MTPLNKWRLDRNADRWDEQLRARLNRSICYGGKGGGGASAIDPRVGEASLMSSQTGQQALEFAMKQYEDSKPRQAEIDRQANLGFDLNYGMATDQRARGDAAYRDYESVYKPIEHQTAADAMGYDSQANQTRVAGAAISDVNQQAASSRAQQQRSLMAMGVNPNSGKFQGAGRQFALGQTALAAGAGTAARTGVIDKAIGLRAGVANFGRNMPNSAAGAFGQSSGFMGAGMAGTALSNQYDLSRAGLAQGGYGQALQGYNQSGNLMNTAQGQNLAYQGAQAQGQGAMIGAGIGGVAVIAAAMI